MQKENNPKLNNPNVSWNQRITGFYNTNKGIIWIIFILVALFYLFGRSEILPAEYYASDAMNGQYAAGYREPNQGSQIRQALRGITMSKITEAASDAAYQSYPSGLTPPYPDDEAGYVPGADKKIRKTGWLQLAVEKELYDAAKNKIENIMGQSKGFYISKNEYKTTIAEDLTYRTYQVALKVPVEHFDVTIDQLKGVAEVKNLNVYASDLTSQYADIKSDLETQKQLKKRVEELIAKAEKIEDIIRLEEKLSEYAQRIDTIQKQLVNIERQTAYSTITVTLEEKHEVKESFYEFTGLQQLVRNVVQSFNRIVVAVSNMTGWIVLALLAWGGYRLYQKRK